MKQFIAIQKITAAEAREIMYSDLSKDLDGNILLAAYCAVLSSAACGAISICDDFCGLDPDHPERVAKAVRKVAAKLRRLGYACTATSTALDIEWGA